MRKAVIQIGDHTVTLDSGRSHFICEPSNPSLELQLNDYLRSIRGYWPDRLAHYAEQTAAEFGGTLVHLDRLPVEDRDDPNILY